MVYAIISYALVENSTYIWRRIKAVILKMIRVTVVLRTIANNNATK